VRTIVSPQKNRNLYVVVFVLLINFGNSQDDKFFIRHPFGVITVSSFIKVLQVNRELECAFACNKYSQCKSFNLAAETNIAGKYTCQLLKVDMLEKSVTETKKFHHFEIFHLVS